MKHLTIKLAATALLCLPWLPAQATVMLAGGLSHEYKLQPGGTMTGQLELRNTGKQPVEIKLYQEDVRIRADGSTEYVPGSGSHARSNAAWISLPTDRIVLAPGAKQPIAYTLQVPNQANLAGSYWSSLVLEPVSNRSPESQLKTPQSPDKPDITIQQRVRYAVQVVTNIGNQGQANLTFSPPKISKTAKGQRQFQVDVRNTGNQFSRPKVWLDVFSPQGQEMGRFEADTHGLYAGERESFQLNIASLPPGQYKGLLAAEDNGSGQVFGSDINLNIQP